MFEGAESEMLLGRQASEITSPIDHAVLFAPSGHQFETGTDGAPIAFRTGEEHGEIVPWAPIG